MSKLSPTQFDLFGGEHPYGPQPAPQADPGLHDRLARKHRNEVDVVNSTLQREAPDADSITTRYFGLGQASEKVIPKGAGFSQHPQAVRQMVGQRAEVPLQGLATVQRTVNLARHREVRDDPHAGASPRYPGSLMVDVPFMWRSKHGDNVVIDGNHRVTAAVARGEMFTPARVITDKDMPKMRAATKRVNQRRADVGVDEFDRLNRYTSGY